MQPEQHLKMESYTRKNTLLWISYVILQVLGITKAANATDLNIQLTASPSTQISTGEQLKLECSTNPSTATVPPMCQFEWSHAYFSDRDGPIIETITNKHYVGNRGRDSRHKVKVVSQHPSESVLVVPYMRMPLQGIFRCALVCMENSTQEQRIVAETSIQIRVMEGNVSMWVKKDLAMMMVSAVIIIFVVCMLLAGLVLRVRQCYARREFEREQERRQRLYDAESMIEDDNGGGNLGGKSSSSPPPRYSEVVDAEEFATNENTNGGRSNSIDNRRTLCSRQNSSDSTRALCPNNTLNNSDSHEDITTTTESQDSKTDIVSQDTEPSKRSLCLSPELLESGALCQDSSNSQDTLYTLMDQSESAASFDHGVLAFQPPPDYEEAVEEMEKQGIQSINRSALSPMPPAYSELSLHV